MHSVNTRLLIQLMTAYLHFTKLRF